MNQRGERGKQSHAMPDYSRNGGGRRISTNEEKEVNNIGPDDTVYRYLCPSRKTGSVIGIGGEIAKQLRAETQARIRISETIPGCDERVITIYSSNLETNNYRNEAVSSAQDALFRVHERVLSDELPVNGAFDESLQLIVRLLVPSDQIGCVIGKGGQIIQNIRNETHAQIRILGSEHLPPCALNSDELIRITGEPTVVEKALFQVALRLHDNPSRSQQSLLNSRSIYRSGITFNNPNAGGPFVGPTLLMGPYGNYKTEGSEWSSAVKEFALRLVCPTKNLGAVFGKGGDTITQIRQESGALVVIHGYEGDSVIHVSSKEVFEAPSRTIDAIMRLQQLCSEKLEKSSSDDVIITRLLVSSSRIGCIIGKAGAIIKEMRSTARANIHVFSDGNVPKGASEDDELVQITGNLNAAKNALLQVLQRVRTNFFESEGTSSSLAGSPPHFPTSDDSKRASLKNRRLIEGYSANSDGYNSKSLPSANNYSNYDDSKVVGGNGYKAHTSSPADHSGGVTKQLQRMRS